MKLGDLIDSKGITQADLGGMLTPPVSQSLVSQWINGITRITLARALEIEEVTDKEVTVRECFELVVRNREAA